MRIKDICFSITDGSHNPPQGIEKSKYMMLSSKNIFDDEITFAEPRYLSEDDFEKENKRTQISQGDVLLTIVGTVGRAAVVNKNMPAFSLQRSVAVLHPKKDICSGRFLMYALRGKRAYIENRAKGVAQKGIYLGDISNIDINIPNLYEQEEIIDKLDKIGKIIKLRKQELRRMDDLVRARFIELFGDPMENPKGWKVVTIGEVVTDVRYGTSKPAVVGGKYPYLRMNNITTDGHLNLADLKYIDIPDDEIEKCIVRKGDVLFNRTNSIELVGKTAFFDLPNDMVIAGYIIRVRLNEKLLPEVFSQYLNLDSLKSVLRAMAKGAVNQANINAQELQSIKIYLPDMVLQKQFIEIKEQVEKSKVTQIHALRKTNILILINRALIT